MRFSIRIKLLAAFAVMIGLMLTVGLFAVARLRVENRHVGQLASQVVPSTRAVGEVDALMNEYRKDQLHYIVARPADRPGAAGIDGDLSGDLSLMRASLTDYRADGLDHDRVDHRLLNAFQAGFARYVRITAGFRTLADRGQIRRAGELVGDGRGDRAYDVLKRLSGEWLDHQVTAADNAAARSRSTYSLSVTLIGVLLVVAVLIAFAVAVALARQTTRAVRAIGAAAKAISEGDIDQRVTVTSRDELGEMATDFGAMVDYLKNMVTIAETIARGDLSVQVHPRSARDELGVALVGMTDSLRSAVGENEQLLAASREEAGTDALTGLSNRRALMRDLEAAVASCDQSPGWMVALFDLDGFKHYNDAFGHPAGDALLVRVSERLQAATNGHGTAYRMGGDEFCVLAKTDETDVAQLAQLAADALAEDGEGFAISSCYGVARIPLDATTAEAALQTADTRMYQGKAGRASAGRESTEVLLKALGERHAGLDQHVSEVATQATQTARALNLPDHEVKRIAIAAALHDVGKIAIPDSILKKPGSLNEEEWEFMRRHTVIGERIVLAAPSLAHAADLVRSSHERYDGTGYPDQRRGEDIPLGASIIAVCDAYDAMITNRPYGQSKSPDDALVELRRCSGSQFDPRAVTAFCDLARSTVPTAA